MTLYSPAGLSLGAGNGSPYGLLSLMDPRVSDFAVCVALCLLGWGGDFQAPYMYNWKTEVSHITFLEVLTTIIFVGIWRIFTCHKSLDSEAKTVSNKLGKKSFPKEECFQVLFASLLLGL